MVDVWFQNNINQERIIGTANNQNEINLIISKFLKEHNYKSYYIRTWYNPEENRTWYDVGSHSEFFFIKNEE